MKTYIEIIELALAAIQERSRHFCCTALREAGRLVGDPAAGIVLADEFADLFFPSPLPEDASLFGYFGKPWVDDPRGDWCSSPNEHAFALRETALGLFLAIHQQEEV